MPPDSRIPAYQGLGSEEALRALSDHLPDALFTTDLEGRVTHWNRGAERITGWTREEALGRDCSILAGDAMHGCSCGIGPLRCGLAETGRTSKRCTVRTKDGRLVTIVKNAVPLVSASGETVGAIETFVEVGEAEEAVRATGAPPPPEVATACGLAGRAPAMVELCRLVELVARSEATVMILGESGVGKEVVAEAIHRRSPRAAGPFVRVSCSALNENLLESELFGHVKGAFTGALRDRRGRFEEAHGGTLLLDEIGDVSPLVQVKLLRVIEQREVERVGDSVPRPVDVRLLCATHRNLKRLVAEGKFRADLYFRLAVFPLRVPSLRERPEDVELHVRRVLERLAPGRPPAVASDALERLRAYAWPGNVRELQNVVEYAALQSGGGEIRLGHLPEEVREGDAGEVEARAPAPARRDAAGAPPAPGLDRDRMLALLARHGGNRTAAARELGVSRVTLWKRLRRLGIGGPDEPEA